ncbi:alpha/beta fold hydrolase [Helicobacter bizzozeronii]|uniref:alpha/beta fold hydrolase n=1 Tax=Helicobacter bizzozeronii TaxID=56877 RepID=UPI000CED8FDD|nr:alpha/beta hydrolase [Helicobacter bizzozeronii]
MRGRCLSGRFSSQQPSYLDIHFDHYQPPESRGVVVQIATGMVEHKRHYVWLAEQLCDQGYEVFVADHRGHGLSVLENSTEVCWGEMGADGFEWAVKDMAKLATHIKTLYPTHKLVLLGHSMGSLLARRLVQHNYCKLDALVLTGTPAPFLGLGLYVFLLKIFRGLGIEITWGLNALFSKHPRVKAMGSKGSWLCRDERVIKLYSMDKASRFVFSTNSFICLLEGARSAFYAHAYGDKSLPILLLSGLDDVCGDFGVGVVRAYRCLAKQGFSDITLRLFEKDRHKIFDELDKQEVLQTLLGWLERKGL